MSSSEVWRSLSDLLYALEQIAEEGAVVVFKMDGARGADRYTISISGGLLEDDFIRKDGADLRALTESAVDLYRSRRA